MSDLNTDGNTDAINRRLDEDADRDRWDELLAAEARVPELEERIEELEAKLAETGKDLEELARDPREEGESLW